MKIGDDQFGGLQIGVPGVGSADNKADHKVLGGYMNTFNQEEHDKRTGKFKKDTSKTAPSFHREESIDGGYKHPDPTRPDPTRPDPTSQTSAWWVEGRSVAWAFRRTLEVKWSPRP